MIEYVVSGNLDPRTIARAAALLAEGGIAALPTDTAWAVVCSMRSRDGVRRLRRVSGARDESRFTLLCGNISQAAEWCSLDNTRFRLVKRLTPGPYVFVLRTLLGAEKTLGLRRREIGVRLPDHPVPAAVIAALGCPLYSVTAKRGMTDDAGGGDGGEAGDDGYFAEQDLFEDGWELDGIPGLDLVLDPGESSPRLFSTVLDLKDGEARLERTGAGAWPA